MEIIFLILGFIIMIKGADLFVDGSVIIAKKLGVSNLIIGLTLVAFGTSAPEIAISIGSALKGESAMAFGNIIGSSLLNLLLVLGITALIKPIPINKSSLKKEMPFMIFISLITLLLALNGNGLYGFSRYDGFILIILFIIYIYSMINSLKNTNNKIDVPSKKIPIKKSIIFTLIGAILITFGADITVKNSILIASKLGMSEIIIGFTIVAFGTSLPELVTSVVAAFKGESDIAIGNIIGSNIFNILIALGITASINPFNFDLFGIYDMIFLLIATSIAFIFMKTNTTINRLEGAIFLILYLVYMFFRIFTSL